MEHSRNRNANAFDAFIVLLQVIFFGFLAWLCLGSPGVKQKMPYIKQKVRDQIDPILSNFIKQLRTDVNLDYPELEHDGAVNYIITKLLKELYPRGSYYFLNRALGVLTAVQLEYYRRVVAPYEDKKIKENGDV